MKVIDLVEQITLKNIPKRIKYNDYEWEYDGENYKIQASSGTYMNWDYIIFNCLNEDVEIIEESQPTKEEIKEYTNKFLEVWTPIQQQFGKLFDELIRIKNDSGLNLEDNIKEEPQEHKIPEKLEIEQDTPNSNFYIRNEYGTKCALTKHSKIIADKINEILDYLEEIE